MVLVVLSGLVAAAVHYLYGGHQPVARRPSAPRAAARVQLSVLIGVFVLLKAAAYWLDRYELVITPNSLFTGAGYTDVNAVLPAKTILTVRRADQRGAVLRQRLPAHVATGGAQSRAHGAQRGRHRLRSTPASSSSCR